MSAPHWTVYILETANGSYYTGIATDLMARYRAHESGQGSRAVRMAGGPRRIAWHMEGLKRDEALRLERAIKGLSREGKERLLAEGLSSVGLAPTKGSSRDNQ